MVRRQALRGSHVALLPRVLVLQLLRSVWDPRVGAPVKDGRHVAFPTRLGRDDLALLRGQRQEPHSEQRHHGKQQQAEAGYADLAQHNGSGEGDGGKEGEGEGEGANDDVLLYGAGCGDERYVPYTLTAVVVHYGGASSGHYLMYCRVPAAVRGGDVGRLLRVVAGRCTGRRWLWVRRLAALLLVMVVMVHWG